MDLIALKMLFRDNVKFLTLVIGITFAVVLITQQGSIFCGLMLRTGTNILEINAPLWVMDPKVSAIDNSIPFQSSKLYEVRSLSGVEWAVPLLMNTLTAKSDKGDNTFISLIGLDDESLIGIPDKLVEDTQFYNIDQSDTVFISSSRSDFISKLKIGDYFEVNDHRLKVAGKVNSSKSFVPYSSVYTVYDRAISISPPSQKHLSFILVKPQTGVTIKDLKQRIKEQTGLKAYSKIEFFWENMGYWAKNTGIPINFGITIFLGVIIGAATAGQTLYSFVFENIKQFGTFKAIGISNSELIKMVILQSSVVAFIGFGIGIGILSIMGFFIPENGDLGFYTPYQLILLTFFIVYSFCLLASLISIQKVLKIEPAIVFRGG
jgi:putative ABC transport system permease protein